MTRAIVFTEIPAGLHDSVADSVSGIGGIDDDACQKIAGNSRKFANDRGVGRSDVLLEKKTGMADFDPYRAGGSNRLNSLDFHCLLQMK